MSATTTSQDDPSQYFFHHAMIRIKDPKKSIAFYENALGMRQIAKYDFPNGKFSLYFLSYFKGEIPTKIQAESGATITPFEWLFSNNIPFVELTHNWGTEEQPEFKYHSGNEEPARGFGHLAIVVPDVVKACERMEGLGVKIRRKPGPMQGTVNIAFVEDPDGYWIELIEHKKN